MAPESAQDLPALRAADPRQRRWTDLPVDLRKPSWTLEQPCPVCGQGSALALVACPSCSWVAVQCVEEGTFFLAPKSLNARHQGDRCPRCRERILAEFEAATDVQLHRAGLRAGDYT
jgi:hypothetical protein